MASYTDTVPQFNEYVSQQPVEDMVKVGMLKQQQYDTNVEKIQQTMSSVANMPIARDVDKKHLENLMTGVTDQLSVVAAGDFSSSNLTRSVNGLINGIASDEIVQNSVSSTMRAQQAQKKQQLYNEKGEGSPSNDWLLTTELQEWYNNPEAGASFSGTSRPYQDFKKKTLDIIKQLKPDSTITDDAFHYEGNKLVIHDAIVRDELKGISPEKIQQALLSGLSAGDWKQMEIDGRYTYSNVDGAVFGERVQGQYNSMLSFYDKEKEALEGELVDATDIRKKAEIKNRIKVLENDISNSKRKYSGILQSIEGGNFEGAKAELYTGEFIQGISQAFSSTERSQTIENNPYAEMDFKRQSLDIKNQQWAAGYNLDLAKFQQQTLDSAADRAIKKEANALKRQEILGYDPEGGLPGSVDKSVLPERTIATVQNKIDGRRKRITTKDAEFSKGHTPGWIDQRYAEYLKTGVTSDPALAEWFEEKRELTRNNYSDQLVIDDVQTEADSLFPPAESFVEEEDADKGVAINTANGQEFVSTADMVKFNNKVDRYWSNESPSFGEDIESLVKEGKTASSLQFDDEGARQNLTPKEFALYQVFKRDKQREAGEWQEDVEGGTGLSKNLTEYERTIVDFNETVKEKYNEPYQDILKEKLNFISEEVGQRVSITQGVDYAFTMKAADLQANLGGKLTTIANLMGETGGGFPEFEGTEKDVRAVAKDVVSATMKVIEGNEYQEPMYILTASSDDSTIRVRLNETQKRSMFGNLYESPNEIKALRPYEAQIRKMNGARNDSGNSWGSTSFDGEATNVGNSFLGGPADFPNIKAYGISGNIEKTESGLYTIKINIYDPVTKGVLVEDVSYPAEGLMEADKVNSALQLLDDNYIFERIEGVSPASKIKSRADLIKLYSENEKPN